MRHIQLKRDGKILTDFDLYELLVKGDKTGDMQLQPGDVLYIPPAGPQVALLGSVREPAIYELRGEETLGDLVDAAGGRTAMAVGSSISIDRIAGHTERSAFALADDAEGSARRWPTGTSCASTRSHRITATRSRCVDRPPIRDIFCGARECI